MEQNDDEQLSSGIILLYGVQYSSWHLTVKVITGIKFHNTFILPIWMCDSVTNNLLI